MPTAIEQTPALVRQLYTLVAELERLFPGRKFTPDGHLVGSLGEALAQYRYGLTLLPSSAEAHDALAGDGRRVQIKATQTNRIGLYGKPDHLIVLRLARDGSAEEVFNGPGEVAWPFVSRAAKNGQSSIGLSTLKRLMRDVAPDQQITAVAP